nr:PREDICTED: chlorophyll(ide) b reductase NOL, chloroplastic isoform X2 [Musa acuminata subsp. malaccensis]
MASVSSLPAFAISDYRTRSRVPARSRSSPNSGISGPGAGLDSLGRAAASCRRLNPWHRRGDWNLGPVRAESHDVKKTEREPMVPPYNVLITGSTKGIGYALAREFLKAVERVESAIQSLRKEFGEHRVWGTACDVRVAKDVKALVAFARETIGYIDIWINNAGSNAYSFKPLAETSDEDLMEVVTTNTLGLMICCREAINMMLNQPRGGHIFNIDGAGSDGRPTPRFAAYGATKRSVVHLTKSLQAELQMQEVKNVMVHNLSPGMVTTDLLMSGATTKQAKFFINILAEPPDVVAAFLVPSIRSVPSSQSMKPTYIRFLTGFKAYSQIFSRLAFGARRNRYLVED